MLTKIVIADDHGLIRAGLRALLENTPDIQVVGEAGDGLAALRLVTELQPDLVLMDISMPGMDGIEAARKVNEISPKTQVLAMTVHEDESTLLEMIRAGASGYIIKTADESELLNAIRVISNGDIYIHPSMTRALLNETSPKTKKNQAFQEALTDREMDVLRLLARGYTNRQIAQELSISPRTVEGHRANLVAKLGISSRMELLNYAEENGLMEPFKSGDKDWPARR
jgi:two-component system, NarL family, response regulator NreC